MRCDLNETKKERNFTPFFFCCQSQHLLPNEGGPVRRNPAPGICVLAFSKKLGNIL